MNLFPDLISILKQKSGQNVRRWDDTAFLAQSQTPPSNSSPPSWENCTPAGSFMSDSGLDGQKQERREGERDNTEDKEAKSRVSSSSDAHHDRERRQRLQSERIILTNPLQSHSHFPPSSLHLFAFPLTRLHPTALNEEMKDD